MGGAGRQELPQIHSVLVRGELKIACQDPEVYWANTGGSLEFTDNRPIHIPIAIHSIAQVGVLVGRDDFLAMMGHISNQLHAFSVYSALGCIHSHFPSVRPFGYGIQCGL
ncbi:hypothetical protein AYI69_g11512 [Smittium culicis]|uniref:Uncharacterized protein n=1 Tax=Smittium culicis TaxID=133412 RepID=A0A1R1WY15_9FUNG|nr:hypothetical protein AYI69_g11512 [Smittium culicis]